MRIRCSLATYELLKDTKILSFEENWVTAKGKGELKTYFVEIA